MSKDKPELTPETAAREPFMPLIRELVRAYQAFEAYSNAHIRETGLTPPQFDVVATLGNTEGMTFKELGERTLTTKGTLTGIIDRLEEKGIVKRVMSEVDRRSTLAVLTPEGEALFRRAFPRQICHLKERLAGLSAEDVTELTQALRRLRDLF